jgi:putative SOS response-associated peptidase YedK
MFTHPDSAGASPSRLNFDFPLSPKYFFPVCCRYSETVDPMMLADVLAIDACTYEFEPRPMIYPTEAAPVIVSENGRTEIRPMRWGLIPHWAKDESLGKKLFNARVETAAQKPAFRDAWQKRRCLIPATGFYEWNHNSATGEKEPHHFHLPNNEIFCFAGLWETWERLPPKQAELFDVPNNLHGTMAQTFTILTTSPNKLVSKYHDRMPVMKLNAIGDWIYEGGIDHEFTDQIPLLVQRPNQS